MSSGRSAVFDAFANLFDQTVRHAKVNGTFDEGVTDIKAIAVRLARTPRVVSAGAITGAETTHYTLEVDRPARTVSFAEADRVRRSRKGAFLRHNKKGKFILAVASRHHTDPATGRSFQTFAVWPPEGERTDYLDESKLNEKYTPVSAEAARDWWMSRHAAIPPVETTEMHIIGGAILPLWQRLKTREGTRLRVVRVSTDAGQRIVGVWIPRERVRTVLCALGIGGSLRSPEEIFNALLGEGGEAPLAANLRLKQGPLHGEAAIELCGANPYKFAQLRELGLINEQINWKQRFFIPTDENTGIETLTALLRLYPVIVTEEMEGEEFQACADGAISSNAAADKVIDLAEWIISVGEEKTEERERQEAEPQTVSEVPAAEEPPAPLPPPPPQPATPRRTGHSDRESLGPLTFNSPRKSSRPYRSPSLIPPPVVMPRASVALPRRTTLHTSADSSGGP